MLGECCRRVTASHARVKETRAVNMHMETMGMRFTRYPLPTIHAPHRAAPAVLRIFSNQHLAHRVVNVAGSNGGSYIFSIKQTTITAHSPHHGATQRSRPAGFVVNDVTLFMRNDFIASAARHANRQLVCHGSTWNEHRRFLPKARSDHRF